MPTRQTSSEAVSIASAQVPDPEQKGLDAYEKRYARATMINAPAYAWATSAHRARVADPER